MIELIGYLGMIITVISFVYKDVKKIRITNGIACLIWIFYGFYKDSYPIIFVNLIVLIIHMYWLNKHRQ